MKSRRFFRRVWQFNALVIAVAAILAIVLMCFVIFEVYKSATRTRNASSIVNVDTSDMGDVEVNYRLGRTEYFSDNEIISFRLLMVQEYDFSYGSTKTTENTVNYLFFDINLRQNRWLLEGNDQLILQRTDLSNNPDARAEPIAAHLYTLVRNDTNGDGKLTAEDNQILAIARADGSQFTELFTDVATSPVTNSVGDGRAIISFRDITGLLYIAEIDLSDFSITHKTAIDGILPD